MGDGRWESKTVNSKCKSYLFCRPKPDKAHLGRIESIANANGSHIVEREGEEEKKRRKRNGRTEFFHAGGPSFSDLPNTLDSLMLYST
jgi:hypothetical protein